MLLNLAHLKSLNSGQLDSLETYAQIEGYVLGLDAGGEAGEVMSAFRVLFDLVSKTLDTGLDQATSNKYFGLLNVLKANSLWVMDPKDVSIFFAESILTVLLFEDVEFKQKLKNLFATYGADMQERKALAAELYESLLKNEQRLGTLDVKGWLVDYRNSNSGKTRSAAERVEYINQNKNAVLLTSQERKSLQKLLEIFDILESTRGDYKMTAATKPVVMTEKPPVPRPQVTMRELETAVPRPPGRMMSMQAEKPEQSGARMPSQAPRMMSGQLAGPVEKKMPVYRTTDASLAQKLSGSSQYFGLSHAIINAGQERKAEGNIRIGKSEDALTKKPVPPQAPKAMEPAAPLVTQRATDLIKPKQEEHNAPTPVVDLNRPVPIKIENISNPEELAKIKLSDLAGLDFEARLAALQEKIRQLSREKAIPVNTVANSFFRSPVYNLYMDMGVAVMNDQNPDRKAVFEKIAKNYETAGKPHLSKDQFLAIHRLKKEITSK